MAMMTPIHRTEVKFYVPVVAAFGALAGLFVGTAQGSGLIGIVVGAILGAAIAMMIDGVAGEGLAAYFEVCHELKLIINLIERGGLNFMRYSISNTAEFGDYHTGPKIVDAQTKQRMKQVLTDIQSGQFAKTFRDDYAQGFKWFKAQRDQDKNHPVEQIGRELRSMMPWLEPVEDKELVGK